MQARIYRPAKSAMQAGTANSKRWVLEHSPSSPKSLDPLMGWTSSTDMQTQVRLTFESREAAVEYAETNGIEFVLMEPKKHRLNVRLRGYAENFAHDRRNAWTH